MMGEMDHDDVRELLEDAAIDPGGLERLMAGDTPSAALVAGHLAACPDCAEELARLHRAVGMIRPVVRSVPPPELRERTLAHIAAVGRPRGDPASEAATARPSSAPVAAPHAGVQPDFPAGASIPRELVTLRPAPGRGRLPALAALAAALIVAVGGTGLVVTAARDGEARQQAAEIDALGDVARWTLRVGAQPDVRRVALSPVDRAPGGMNATGELVFSPASKELVVVAERLPLPPAGREYRCWVEVDGKRTSIGKMFFGGDLAYWVGEVGQVAGLQPAVQFGVSLVDLDGSTGPGEAVLAGIG